MRQPERPKHLKAPYHYQPLNQMIYRKVSGMGEMRVLDVRAWGYLAGGGGLNLPQDEAQLEQDRFGIWATAVLNEAFNDVVSVPIYDLSAIYKDLPEGSGGQIALKALLGLHVKSFEPAEEDLKVKWRPRGIGTDHGIPSLVDGVVRDYGESPGLSGFVFSRAEGELAVQIFGGRAHLDWRNFEQGWIQVKVHAPREVLVELCRLVAENDHYVTPAIVAEAIKKAPVVAEV